ncbi:hydantoinase/oxoprolinase family protein [Conexibacter sp. CPCC 206217]|uniref:hydantoinase/oxoprolinase family protein n=1 Tax=Conexibacter sp. CPCC 206217 TaxID=3064574 RepID=UPI0027180557|nr:hydantoinase/oxoprolinase family protein [Conexibacter sp. CPCC 206217]MDO8211647.1 hydantoinase/oxoprolinase family protein [Conexibacter sp. CPCC 206217]
MSGTASSGRFRIGLDIGGTFTDLAVHDALDGSLLQVKSPSTVDPVECVTASVDKAAATFELDRRGFLEAVDRVFCFGSTHGLNTLLTGQGSKVGIVTTKGHGDAYTIAQMNRHGIHDIRDAAEGTFSPLIPRSRIREVDERIDSSGAIVVELAEAQVRRVITELVEEEGVEALVVAFLWAHRWPIHERRVAELARELYPDLFVTAGSDIAGTLGEFTRLSTAVINAYIGKRVQMQSNRLSDFLAREGLGVPVLVMQMLGGVAPIEEISERPVALLKSGPVGGTVAAAAVAKQLGQQDVVCIDMGGTSLDVCRITAGEMQLSRGFSILKHPITIPGVEIESVGSGGGSIAVLEEAGGLARLRVGPESASSKPGPACYGRGGTLPTVTDANLVLGILDDAVPLGGEIQLDRAAAESALRERIADRLGQQPVESAWGVYQVVTAQMADAIERFMVSSGVDPRQYALMAFGAAAPAHALAIAARLGSPQVVIPAASPIFSAYGLMMTDIRHAYEVTDDSVRFPIDGANVVVDATHTEHVRERLAGASERPQRLLDREQVDLAARELSLFVDMRYSGQELQLSIEVPTALLDGDAPDDALEQIVAAWRRKYDQVYGAGASWSEGAIEIVNYRAVAVGRLTPVQAVGAAGAVGAANGNGRAHAAGAGAGASSPVLAPERREPAPSGSREVYLGGWLTADAYVQSELMPGDVVRGPAVIDGELTTTVLGAGDELTVAATGDFVAVPSAGGWRW